MRSASSARPWTFLQRLRAASISEPEGRRLFLQRWDWWVVMFDSEGARRLIALGAVIAGVGAQSFITSEVDAYQNVADRTYGVKLLGSELAAPVSPAHQEVPALPASVTGHDSSATNFFVVPSTPEPTGKRLLPTPGRLEVDSERYRLRAPNDWPERRDATGSIIELSENDVLIPTRLPYR